VKIGKSLLFASPVEILVKLVTVVCLKMFLGITDAFVYGIDWNKVRNRQILIVYYRVDTSLMGGITIFMGTYFFFLIKKVPKKIKDNPNGSARLSTHATLGVAG